MLFHPNFIFFLLKPSFIPPLSGGGGCLSPGRTHLSTLKSPQSNQSSQQPKGPNQHVTSTLTGVKWEGQHRRGCILHFSPHLFHFSFPVFHTVFTIFILFYFLRSWTLADRSGSIFGASLKTCFNKITHLWIYLMKRIRSSYFFVLKSRCLCNIFFTITLFYLFIIHKRMLNIIQLEMLKCNECYFFFFF